MQKLLEFLVQSIVPHPKEVAIEEQEEEGVLTLRLRVNPEDLKIVIGKKGRTIRAIRDLLRIKAGKEGRRVNLVLEEES